MNLEKFSRGFGKIYLAISFEYFNKGIKELTTPTMKFDVVDVMNGYMLSIIRTLNNYQKDTQEKELEMVKHIQQLVKLKDSLAVELSWEKALVCAFTIKCNNLSSRESEYATKIFPSST